jgi:hypothetical protein
VASFLEVERIDVVETGATTPVISDVAYRVGPKLL